MANKEQLHATAATAATAAIVASKNLRLSGSDLRSAHGRALKAHKLKDALDVGHRLAAIECSYWSLYRLFGISMTVACQFETKLKSEAFITLAGGT